MILHRLAFLLLLSVITNFFTPVIGDLRCEIRNFETTRLKSTAGAGVGAVLFEEASFLNPASLAFFQTSSIYYQNMSSNNNIQTQDGTESINKSEATAFIVTDAGGALNGSFNYIKQKDQLNTREQFGVAFASLIGEKSSFGTAISTKKDKIFENGEYTHSTYEQFNFGVSHILSENITFGLTVMDAFRTKPEESKVILGLQYVYKSFLSFMVDVGADYKKDIVENGMTRAAAQARFLNDFFIRFGVYNDKAIQEKGNGIGISWVTPKLSVDVAQNTIIKNNNDINVESDKVEETTFSVSYRF